MTDDGYVPVVRALVALILVGAYPFVLFFADGDMIVLKAYTDAVTAVVAFYFAARASEG